MPGQATPCSSIEVVITSTTGNRVAVKSGPRVRISPAAPKKTDVPFGTSVFFIRERFELKIANRRGRLARPAPPGRPLYIRLLGGYANESLPAAPRRRGRLARPAPSGRLVVAADVISFAVTFCKSHLSLILSRLLSKSNPLRWASIWFWVGA